MPELPEVETVRLQLLHKIKGKVIDKVQVLNTKSTGSNRKFASHLKGKKMAHIDRIGKLMIFSFAKEPNFFLLAHLKMTGQFFFVDKRKVSGGGHTTTKADTTNLPNKHTRIAFYFIDGSTLFFNDMRKFGYVKIANAKEVELAKARFGQEPISDDFDIKTFTASLKRRKTPIKAVLLDQSFVAGLGNIYVDEALYLAKVRPDRHADTITAKEAKAIAKYSGEIMKKSISVGGTTFQHFADTKGEAGNFKDYLKVFGKQNTPCPKCKSLIQKTRVAGRGTHFCPNCQK
ncbi:MAG: bifunctional DNA-formamidopyrimidine glycosylase/DNA-(apurinic or apyrimidinic site) lyase [Candidatus Paceibacterota bacterium]